MTDTNSHHMSGPNAALQPASAPQEIPPSWNLGRIGRLGFLLGLLYATSIFFVYAGLVFVINFGVDMLFPGSANNAVVNNVETVLAHAARILFAIAITTLAIRRLHDVEFSGWVMLLGLVPLVNLALLGCLLLAPSREPNKYGPPLDSLNFWRVLGFKIPKLRR